mgnify:CR=1 FL=1
MTGGIARRYDSSIPGGVILATLKTSVTLDAALLDEARTYSVNVSSACRTGLEDAVRAARRAGWKTENAAAIAEYNLFFEENGILLAEYRTF